jgi:hypothetical protein
MGFFFDVSKIEKKPEADPNTRIISLEDADIKSRALFPDSGGTEKRGVKKGLDKKQKIIIGENPVYAFCFHGFFEERKRIEERRTIDEYLCTAKLLGNTLKISNSENSMFKFPEEEARKIDMLFFFLNMPNDARKNTYGGIHQNGSLYIAKKHYKQAEALIRGLNNNLSFGVSKEDFEKVKNYCYSVGLKEEVTGFAQGQEEVFKKSKDKNSVEIKFTTAQQKISNSTKVKNYCCGVGLKEEITGFAPGQEEVLQKAQDKSLVETGATTTQQKILDSSEKNHFFVIGTVLLVILSFFIGSFYMVDLV